MPITRLVALAVCLLALTRPVYGAVGFVAAGGAGNGGSTTAATTGSLNMTGATALFVGCSQYFAGGTTGTATVTDSSSNVYTLVNEKADDTNFGKIVVYKRENPTVTAAMTFTCTNTDFYGSVVAIGVNGTGTSNVVESSAFAQGSITFPTPGASQDVAGGFSTLSAGTVAIQFLMLGDNGGTPVSGFSATDSYTLDYSLAFSGAQMGAAVSHKLLAAAGATNPSIAWSSGTTAIVSTVAVVVKQASAGGASGLTLLGVGR